ncbi:MAG TPA: SMP-30/gluconolactonase/LRE family protein [Polyangiaceae bacterium]|nr:SMP-30/gluconolactonase/LRE family protein [Polyangiaceae bacterium]
MVSFEPVANYHCQVGENPRWDEREGRLYWLDIEDGRLFRVEHEGLEHECFHRNAHKIGGFTLQEDGSLLLFEVDRISVLGKDGRQRVLAEQIDSGMLRFNDAIADPEGRVFAGSIGKTDESGGLYRIELDGSVETMWKGTGCANGMGFSPDLQQFYWTCSTTYLIYVADYQRETGALTNRRIFHRAAREQGIPDGLTVDRLGQVWSARWEGSAVLLLNGQGEPIERAVLPVARVSSAAFGGPELDTLYVTTAGATWEGSVPEDGTLYRCKVPVPGTVEFRSRVRL